MKVYISKEHMLEARIQELEEEIERGITDLKHALIISDRLRKALEAMKLECEQVNPKEHSLEVTIARLIIIATEALGGEKRKEKEVH